MSIEDVIIITRIVENGPEYQALRHSAAAELLAEALYSQEEVIAMQTPGGLEPHGCRGVTTI